MLVLSGVGDSLDWEVQLSGRVLASHVWTLAYTTSGPGLGGVGKEQFFKMREPVRLSQLQVLGAGA